MSLNNSNIESLARLLDEKKRDLENASNNFKTSLDNLQVYINTSLLYVGKRSIICTDYLNTQFVKVIQNMSEYNRAISDFRLVESLFENEKQIKNYLNQEYTKWTQTNKKEYEDERNT